MAYNPNNLARPSRSQAQRPMPGLVRLGRALVVLALLLPPAGAAAAGLRAGYLYNLSGFDGTIPFDAIGLAVDAARDEVYVADPGNRTVRVFNDSGMEIFRFGDDDELGYMYDVAVQDNGEIFLLSYVYSGGAKPFIVRCNYRGERVASYDLKDLPEEFAGFFPYRLLLHAGHLYLADPNRMLVAEFATDGRFVKGYNLGAAIGLDAEHVANSGMGGFAIDAEGRFLFSVTAMFKVYRVARDGQVTAFGRPGSSPGRFGIVRGVAVGRGGMVYVIDGLRSVVMCFDQDFRFLNEFGYRRPGPGGLVAPRDIAVTGKEKVLVTQGARRGVSVFRIENE